MRAIRIRAAGGPEVLEQVELPRPKPQSDEVLVEVVASGVNRADLLQRRGLYPAPDDAPADVPGLEYAGTVVELGSAATRCKVGDRVMGIVGGGAYADTLAVNESTVMPVPEELELAAAAAIPEAFITAYDALVHRLKLRAGERLLIHAVGSGVGTAAVQLARHFGVRTLGTSRSAGKLARAVELGLDAAIPASPGWPRAVIDQTNGRGVDAVLDLVGGSYLAGNLEVLSGGGRLVIVGLVGGAKAELDLGAVLQKHLTFVGTTLRSRPLAARALLSEEVAGRLLPLFVSRVIRPVVDRELPAQAVAEAHTLLEKNEIFGKILLRWR